MGPVVLALGVTQIVGWGTTHYMPAVLTAPIASGLGLDTTWVFGSFSWGLLVAGLSARQSGRLIDRHGAAVVMSAASAIATVGLLLLSVARGLPGLLLGWTLVGLALRSILYDGAFAAITALAGTGARRAISLLTLLGGLASTAFWPIGHALELHLGWRATLAIYAALNLLVCMPLHWWFAGGMRRLQRSARKPAVQSHLTPDEQATSDEDAAGLPPARAVLAGPPPTDGLSLSEPARRRALLLLATVFTLHAFVASAMAAHLLLLLEGLSLGASIAVSAAALMGVAQVAARVLEMILQRRFHILQVAPFAMGLVPLACAVALAMQGSAVGAALFVVLYGCANGLITIVRGSLPLAVFGSRGYGELLGSVAGPALIMAAAAPALFAAIVRWGGVTLGLVVLAATSFAGFAAIGALVLSVRVNAGGHSRSPPAQ